MTPDYEMQYTDQRPENENGSYTEYSVMFQDSTGVWYHHGMSTTSEGAWDIYDKYSNSGDTKLNPTLYSLTHTYEWKAVG